jgi:hypothetical protein
MTGRECSDNKKVIKNYYTNVNVPILNNKNPILRF